MSLYIIKRDSGGSLRFDNLKMRGYYSINEERKTEFNSSQLRYYVERDDRFINLDLTEGVENVRLFDNTIHNEHIDNTLEWIQENHAKVERSPNGQPWLDADFILRRGLIDRLLQTPYSKKNNWIICAAKFKGNIYLCQFETEAEIIQKKSLTPYQLLVSCWGHKFHQYMLSDTANEMPNTSKPCDQNLLFCGVFQSSLGENSLLYSSDVNGVCSEKNLEDPLPLDELKCIQLNTNRILISPRDRIFFAKNTTLNRWSKCVSVGINKIVCGFRDREGIIKELKSYTRNDLINMSKIYWKPSVAMNFLNDFLTYVKTTVVNNCDETIYKFEQIPNSNKIKMTEVSADSSYSFLPNWYTKSEM